MPWFAGEAELPHIEHESAPEQPAEDAGPEEAPEAGPEPEPEPPREIPPYRIQCVLGGPGSGRSTHCRRLKQELGVKILSTGSLLRDAADEDGSEELRRAVSLRAADQEAMEDALATGKPVDDAIVQQLLMNAVNHTFANDPQRIMMLDGFPRNLAQVKWMHQNLGRPERVMFLSLHESESLMLERIMARDTTSDAARAFQHGDSHVRDNSVAGRSKTLGKGRSMYRMDNTEAAARTMINNFNESGLTLPVMQRRGHALFGVNPHIIPATGTIEEVYSAVLGCVEGRTPEPEPEPQAEGEEGDEEPLEFSPPPAITSPAARSAPSPAAQEYDGARDSVAKVEHLESRVSDAPAERRPSPGDTKSPEMPQIPESSAAPPAEATADQTDVAIVPSPERLALDYEGGAGTTGDWPARWPEPKHKPPTGSGSPTSTALNQLQGMVHPQFRTPDAPLF